MLTHFEMDDIDRLMKIADLMMQQRVVILGDPGCGKSTLLRHIAYTIATEQPESGEFGANRLPIYVRLVQFSEARTRNHALTLDTYILEMCEPRWSPLLRYALNEGMAVLLLDGLDEVVDAHQRKSTAETIERFVADYIDNTFCVTSRIVGYQATRLTGDFAHYTVEPLPLTCITDFIDKWYSAIEREAGAEEPGEEIRNRALELSHAIQTRSGIRRLAENPLLLTIIALVNWRGRKLPNRRVELYAHAAETLIESWPYRRQGVELDTERVTRLLSPVAYRIFAAHSSDDITEDELLPILAAVICRVDGLTGREAEDYAIEFLDQISERSGIFRERGYDERGRRTFGFLHLTFAEYFAARYLAGLWEDLGEDVVARQTLLRNYVHVPRWREVVLLMVGDVGLRDSNHAVRATHLLSDILTLNSDYENKLHRDLLLAGECLADDLRVQSKAAFYVGNALLNLVSYPGLGDAIGRILRVMIESSYGQAILDSLKVKLKDPDKWMQLEVAEILRKLDDSQAFSTLLTLLKDDAWYMRARAAKALGELGNSLATEFLIAQLQDEDGWVRSKVVGALEAIGDPVALAALQTRLQDEDQWVRVKTAKTLKSFDNTQDIENLILRLENEDPQVRMEAAETLGELGTTKAVEPLLICLEDVNEKVRWSASWALGAIGDIRALAPLQLRLTDPDRWVRGNSAWALGMLGSSEAADALLLLATDRDSWVQGKEDSWVRGKVAQALGRLGDLRAIAYLLKLLDDDEDRRTQEYAYESLLAILNYNARPPEIANHSKETQIISGPWDSEN